MDSYVKSSLEGRIAVIEFFHPSGNALPSPLLDALARDIRLAGAMPEARVVLLRAGGSRTFCAGASLTELAAIRTQEQGEEFFMGFARVIEAMRLCPKFVLVRVQGKAVGGGVGIIAAADYAIAESCAAIRLSELTVGIGPFVIEPVLRRKLGLAATAHLALRATDFETADWARQKGLYNEVLPTTEALDQRVALMADQLAVYDPESVRCLKEALWLDTEHWPTLLRERAAISGKLVKTPFAQQAISRILASLKS